MMATEFVKAMQVASVVPGVLQSNGTQPSTVNLIAVDGTGFAAAITVDLADALAQYAVGTPMWLRLDDTQPVMTMPPLGGAASENTAAVITATVENVDAPAAQ